MFSVRALSQQDPQWKDKKLGTSPTLTIGQFGCLLTSITMVSNGFGYNETPASLNDKMVASGGFAGGLIRPTMISSVLPGVHYQKRISCNNPPAPLSEIDASLASGMPVVIKVDASPADGVQDHWIVCIAKAGDNDYWVQDTWRYPVEAKLILITSRYGFGRGPADIIKDAIFYTGTPVANTNGSAPAVPPPPPVIPHVGPAPIPANALNVYITADSLAFRSQPFIDSNIMRRLPIKSRLVVLDPPDQAAQKVGVDNQWLFVQNPTNNEQGYVAAWFVSTTVPAIPNLPVTPPAATPQPAAPQGFIVYAAGDNLALRSSPIIGNNLVKRVPMNTQFAVLDPEYSAKQKFGQQGQWLQVRDITGAQGYVAAWCLSLYEFVPPLGVSPKPAAVPAPVATPTPAGATAGQLIVRATVDKLALRSQPIILNTTLVKRLPFAADLLVLDPPDQAVAKIGVVNQWIRVRDILGAEGYVAAWYVIKSPKSSLTEQAG